MKNFQRFYSVFFIVIIAFALNSCNNKKDKVASEDLPLDTAKPSLDNLEQLRIAIRPPWVIKSNDTVRIYKEKILIRGMENQHTVVLRVDTENLRHPHPDSVKRYCSFPDLNPNDPIADYTTDVLAGDHITWIGESMSDPNAVVCIERVNFRSNNKVYGGPFDGVNCKVMGKIKDDAVIGDEERYTISFTVNTGSPPHPRYTLDPKLLVH